MRGSSFPRYADDGYLLSGDPAYVTSHLEARSKIRKVERDELLEELVRTYLAGLEGKR